MPAEKKQINLLPVDPFNASFTGKLLKWALSIGRYIVMGTELVVIGAFLARFSLDRQVTDLNEAIAQRQAIVESYGDLEKEARAVQARLKLVEELETKQLGITGFLQKISDFTPLDAAYTTIQINKDRLRLEGIVFSEAGLRTLLLTMKEQEEIKRIGVQKIISGGTENEGIEFSVEAELKNGG